MNQKVLGLDNLVVLLGVVEHHVQAAAGCHGDSADPR